MQKIIILMLIILCYPSMAKTEVHDIRQLAFEKYLHDFGVMERGGKKTVKFKFTNEGAKPVKILATHAGCGCTVVDAPIKAFEHGDVGFISVEFDAADHVGKVLKTIMVVTDENSISDRILTVKADVKSSFWAAPPIVDLGGVVKGSKPIKSFSLKGPFKSNEPKLDFDHRILEVVKDNKKPMTYQVSLRAEAPIGSIRTVVWIDDEDPATPRLKLPVVGAILGVVKASAEDIDFGSVVPKSSKSVSLYLKSKVKFTFGEPKLNIFINGEKDEDIEKYIDIELGTLRSVHSEFRLPVKIKFTNLLIDAGGAVHGQISVPVQDGKEVVSVNVFGVFLESNMRLN